MYLIKTILNPFKLVTDTILGNDRGGLGGGGGGGWGGSDEKWAGSDGQGLRIRWAGGSGQMGRGLRSDGQGVQVS